MIQPLTHVVTRLAAGEPAEVRRRIEEQLLRSGGRISDSTPVDVTFRFGRPVSWRLWGMWGVRPENRIPFRLIVVVHAAATGSAVSLHAQLESDGYVVQLPATDALFTRALQPILDAVDSVIEPVS